MNPARHIARFRQHGFTPQAGFSLMELMVGMTIAMIATIVIIQVMSVFEAQRRTTTGSADAQTNGGIALYSIAREVQMGGYGLLPYTDSSLECTTVTYGGMGITGLAPVSITDGVASAGVSASDSITIRYGNSLMGGAISQITALVGNAATVGSNLGCAVGDVTLISSGTTCAMSTVTAVSAAGVNPISVTLADVATPPVQSGANLACVGSWNEITYRVDQTTGNLIRDSRVNGVLTSAPSVVGVVNLQAQYGVSASGSSNQITQWVEPTGATWGPGVITVANRNRIKAIRVSVISRNAQREVADVSTACSSTSDATPTGLCAWAGSVASPAPAVDLSPADASWARYRFRVFETIVPVRNVIWARDTL